MWIIYVLLNPILHACSNILDNYLTNKVFTHKVSLIFYASFLNMVFLPLVFLLTGLPNIPTHASLPIFLGLALINILYLYPYYKALESNDTSNVVALFALGQLFVPILAYFMVNEVLTLQQYIGIGIVLISSLAVSLDKHVSIKINQSFWWMLLCTFILSFEYVLYKLLFESVNWVTGFTWPVVFSFALALLFLLHHQHKKHIVGDWKKFAQNVYIFGLEELTTFLGIATGTYALSIAPVSVVKAIISTESIFVLLYAVILRKRFPHLFKEDIDRRSVSKKIVLFVCIIFGLFLVLR
ncbi:DMT family transporter [Patescibacteria group bacterium]|mgnify:CR=1 FL=1|nr:DMT family transporter [Patescibacteria group bacterium]